MKLYRQMAMLNVLVERKSVTASELARQFEVSKRTVLRDLDELLMAGIPIVTVQGKNGGIRISEDYKVDKYLLAKSELSSIKAGLSGIASVGLMDENHWLTERLCDEVPLVSINLASHYKDSLSGKIRHIIQGIEKAQCISFTYYGMSGNSKRTVEPYYIQYQWNAWYLIAFCKKRKAMRTFKLNRLWDETVLNERFEKREIDRRNYCNGSHLTEDFDYQAVFKSDVEYLLVEAYGPNSYERLTNGHLLMKASYTDEAYILRWLLGFGDAIISIEPQELANKVKAKTYKG